MHVLAINGSPKQSGNTAGLIDRIVAAAQAADPTLEVERVSLNSLQFRGCQGCLTCLDSDGPGCPQNDALTPVLRSMATADAWIVGTPIYMSGLAGQTKLFLDRLCAYQHFRKAAPRAGQKVVLAVTQGVPGAGAYSTLVGTVAELLAEQSGGAAESVIADGFISGQSHALGEDAAGRAGRLGRWLVGRE